MEVNPLFAGLAAAAVTALVTPAVIWLARRAGVMDHPGPLKPHAAPVPYLGGLAVFCGVAVGLVGSPHAVALVPLAAALLLGLVDDVTALGVLPRLVAEVCVGVGVAWSAGLELSFFGAAVVVGTVVLINAVNFVDGIDALAAGVCAVSFVGFAIVAPSVATSPGGGVAPHWTQVAAALAGAAVGFLLFNRPPARIYLGDAGSYLLGTGLAALAGGYLATANGDSGSARVGGFGADFSILELVVLVALLGYPVIEVVSTVGRRLAAGRPVFAGDRDHVYDLLALRLLSSRRTAALLVGAQAALVAAAVATYLLGATLAVIALGVVLVAATLVAAVPRQPSQP